ncbi:MAG: glycosyltransferase [Moorea sp. SIO3G5]|nr:glycosyltransferase [Moorena sp. SIO3G5]
MKVILAGHILGQGGIQSHLRWLAKALGEEGFETLVISLKCDQHPKYYYHTLQTFEECGVRVHICTTDAKVNSFLDFGKLQRFLEIKKLIEEFSPDVYLAVGTGWNLFIPPLLSKSKTKLIFHEVMSGVPSGWGDSRWCVRWFFDEVIGQSPTVAKTFAECFGWKKPVSALAAMPEPLELTASLPQPVHKTVELGTAKAALFSRLAPHKQAFWLVQQWDLLKDCLGELHIHGSGPEESLIREYIASQGIGDRVKCFGKYPEGQAYVDLLSSYDLTLLPTIGAEGAPLVLLESMACGVPFVAYGVGGIPDYGVDNLDVLVVPTEAGAFINGVSDIVHKLAQGKIKQERLQQFYLANYSYKTLKEQWFNYLDVPSSGLLALQKV